MTRSAPRAECATVVRRAHAAVRLTHRQPCIRARCFGGLLGGGDNPLFGQGAIDPADGETRTKIKIDESRATQEENGFHTLYGEGHRSKLGPIQRSAGCGRNLAPTRCTLDAARWLSVRAGKVREASRTRSSGRAMFVSIAYPTGYRKRLDRYAAALLAGR
jgi:hypothetical protein